MRALYRNRFPELLTAAEKEQVQWVQGDILDTDWLRDQLRECTEVYHCAGMVSFSPSRYGQMYRTNVDGTTNVVNAALDSGIRKMVHVSSVSALGRKRDHAVITEQVKWDEDANLSAYGKTKYLAELEVWRGIAEGLDAVIINPAIILGVGNWNEGSSAMFKNAWKEFPWYTDGTSGFVDAADVAEIMTRLMDGPHTAERYVIAAENWGYREVFAAMARAFGKKEARRKASPWMGEIVWRLEKLKSLFSEAEPLLTRETAETAQMHVQYDASKLLAALPDFRFRPLAGSITEYCHQYLVKMGLRPQ